MLNTLNETMKYINLLYGKYHVREMADCDWLRSTFSGLLRESKTKYSKITINFVINKIPAKWFFVERKEYMHWYFLFSSTKCVPCY